LSCDGSCVAGAVADAPPVIARETPAAPNARAAFLLFLLELRLACVMVALRISVSGPAPALALGILALCAMNRQDVALVPLGQMSERGVCTLGRFRLTCQPTIFAGWHLTLD
jgi:hypothetical protein